MTKSRFFHIFFCGISYAFLLSSCALNELARKDDVAAAKTDIAEEIIALRSENRALSDRLESTTHQIEDLTSQINTTKKEMADSAKFIQGRLQDLGSSLDQAKQDQQRISEKISTDFSGKIQVMLDEVSKENTKVHERIDKLGERKATPVKKASYNKRKTETSQDESSYTVAPGDTLAKIAKRQGVSLSALMTANNIENPNDLKTGQKLVIPQ